MKILIVDDDKDIRELLAEYAQIYEYEYLEAANGFEALNCVEKENIDLIILDVMMPVMDGWTALKEIRKNSDVPVVLLTARGEEYDKLLGFQLGVDDYVVKPFSPKELFARAAAILRRGNVSSAKINKIEFEGLEIDLNARVVLVDGAEILLTPKEYDLLVFLATTPNRVYNRDQLLEQIWDFDFLGDTRTVDTHIKNIRERLGKRRNYIKTVWGTGYKFFVEEKN